MSLSDESSRTSSGFWQWTCTELKLDGFGDQVPSGNRSGVAVLRTALDIDAPGIARTDRRGIVMASR